MYSSSSFLAKQNLWLSLVDYRKNKQGITWHFFKNILRYYTLIFASTFTFICQKLAWLITRQKYEFLQSTDYLIDSYIYYNSKIIEIDCLSSYLPGLTRNLEKKNINYVIIPRINIKINPKVIYSYYNKIKHKRVKLLSPFQFISFYDVIKIIYICIIQPIQIFKLINNNKLKKQKEFIYYFFFSTLSSPFSCSISYFQYLKICTKIKNKISIIQWSENQNFDRTINLCIRKYFPNHKIIGTQLFVKAPECINYNYASTDHGVYIPNKLLVNGTAYQDKKNNHVTGPSFRYQWIFKNSVKRKLNNSIVVLLPYWEAKVLEILVFLNSHDFKFPITLKFHPSTNYKKFSELISGMNFTTDRIENIIGQFSLVIGSSSGSLLESLACGVPVGVFSYELNEGFNFLPYEYRTINWDSFSNYDQFCFILEKYLSKSNSMCTQLQQNAKKIRLEYFTELTQSNFERSFELHQG